MKGFKQATATQLISTGNNKQEVKEHKEELAIEKKGMRETKSRHLSLLIKPSTYAALKTQSKNKGLSINEIVNQIFEHYVKDKQDRPCK